MVRVGRIAALGLVAVLAVSCSDESIESLGFVSTENIVAATELETLWRDSGVVILDVRPEERFAKGAIPHAINIWRPEYRDNQHELGGMLPTAEHLSESMGRYGIKRSDRIVLYDDRGNADAARLWWVLKQYDYQNVTLLTGGLKNWQYLGLPVVARDPVKVVNESEELSDAKPWCAADLAATKQAVSSGSAIVIDTRTTDEFTGKIQKKGAYRAGRIPGAVHIDYIQCVDSLHRFRPADELRQLFESHGVTPDKEVIAYCHSGARSALVTFVLTELLGYPDVRNYDGSWIEWSYHAELPLETGNE